MKILVVDQVGGAYGQIDIYRSLAALEGQDVTLLVPERSFDGFSHACTLAGEKGSLKIHTGRSLLPNRSHRTILPGLWALLRNGRFDLLYAEAEPESYAGLHAVVGRSGLSRHTRVVLMSWRNIDSPRGVYPFRAAWTHAFAERITLPRIDGLVAHNGTALDLIRARGVSQCVLIPPAVDSALFRFRGPDAAGREIGSKRFTVGYVGRFVREKGIDILLRASARLPMQHEILLVGSGPEESRLRKQCAELGISERVRWVGAVSYGSLPDLYAAMDVVALPSRTTPLWKEQFGRVLIEAMACGVPVVGSDSGEIPATIGDGGLVFTEGDEEGLAAQITRLHNAPRLRTELGERGRRRAVENFSTAKVARMYRDFFKRVVSSG